LYAAIIDYVSLILRSKVEVKNKAVKYASATDRRAEALACMPILQANNVAQGFNPAETDFCYLVSAFRPQILSPSALPTFFS